MKISSRLRVPSSLHFGKGINVHNTSLYLYLSFVLVQILITTQFINFPGAYMISNAEYVLVVIGMPMILLMRTGISLKWVTVSGSFLVLGALSALSNARHAQTVTLFFLIVLGMFVDEKKLFKGYVITATAVVLFTLMMYFLNIYSHEYRLREFGRLRLYMGFIAATYSANYLFYIVLSYFAMKTKPITAFETVVIMAANVVVYYWTDTRAVFYLIILLIVLLWILRLFPKILKPKFFGVMMAAVMPIMAAAAIYLAYHYSPSNALMVKLDELLTDRLRLGNTAIQMYGIHPFGTEIRWTVRDEMEPNYLYVDSSYVNTLLIFGPIVLGVVLVGFTILTYRKHAAGEYQMTVVLVLLAVRFFSDPQLMDLRFNPFLLLLSGLIFHQKDKFAALKRILHERFLIDMPR